MTLADFPTPSDRLTADETASRCEQGRAESEIHSEIDPTDADRAFGLCDLGHGCPELGWGRIVS